MAKKCWERSRTQLRTGKPEAILGLASENLSGLGNSAAFYSVLVE